MAAAASHPPGAIILAAGKGTRMRSELPKVLHEVGGRPMLAYVIDACRAVECTPIVVVVGHRHELVRRVFSEEGLLFALQEPQLGTAHAVQTALAAFPEGAAREVFVLCGDGPLVLAETLRRVLRVHRESGAAATLATAVLDDPSGYGRIIRDEGGRFVGIVEHRDATPAQRAIREVNPSYYCFERGLLGSTLPRIPRQGTSGEYYLTDVLGVLLREGRRVEVIPGVPPEDVLSINTPEDLAMVESLLRERQAP